MNEEIEEYYEELYRLCIDENQPLERRYRQLRESLERVVREKIQGNSLQTTDSVSYTHLDVYKRQA